MEVRGVYTTRRTAPRLEPRGLTDTDTYWAEKRTSVKSREVVYDVVA